MPTRLNEEPMALNRSDHFENLIVKYLTEFNLYTPALEPLIQNSRPYWQKISTAVQHLKEPFLATPEYVNLIFQYPKQSIGLLALIRFLHQKNLLTPGIKEKIIKNAYYGELLNAAIQGLPLHKLMEIKNYFNDILDHPKYALPLCSIIRYLNRYGLLEKNYETILKNVTLSVKLKDEMELLENRGNLTSSTLAQTIEEFFTAESLLKALEAKDYKNAESIIANHTVTNSLTYKRNLFSTLIFEQHMDALKFLLNKGIKPELMFVLTFGRQVQQIQLAKLLLESGVDCNTKDMFRNIPLHYASLDGNKDLVQLLLDYKARVNAKDTNGKTAIELVLQNTFTENRIEILKCLLRAGAYPPSSAPHLRFLLVDQPNAGVIECYDEKLDQFVPVDANIHEQLKATKKDAVVLFFAEYDKEPDSEYFSGVRKFYEHNSSTRNFYGALKDFIVFRVIINNTQQMEPILVKINTFLPSSQEIQHVMIHGHSNNHVMQLGADNKVPFSCLYSSDAGKNNSAIKKSLAQLGKHATFAVFGCSTAHGTENMTKAFSKEDIAQGRLVFGTPNLCAWIYYITITHKGKKIPFVFFTDGTQNQEVEVYKNGENIAACQRTRARL